MKKTLCAMLFSALMTAGAAGCGGGGSGSDLVSEVCNKMESCGYMTSSEVTSCKKEGNDAMGSTTSAQKDALGKCVAMECAAFVTCVSDL